MNDITLKIHQFIKDKLDVDESAITNSASFYDDLDVDSLDFCELIVDIEKEFEISIPDDMYEKFKTVGALVNYVAKKADAKYPIMSDMNVMAEDRLSAWLSQAHREHEIEPAALIYFTFDTNLAGLRLNKIFSNSQTQACARYTARGIGHFKISFEYPW